MTAAALTPRVYNVNLTINLKRGKEEIDLAKVELERLHKLIASQTEVNWAKEQIEKTHKMIFLPSAEQIKKELVTKLNEDSEGEEN